MLSMDVTDVVSNASDENTIATGRCRACRPHTAVLIVVAAAKRYSTKKRQRS